MKATHNINVNGVWYKAGEEYPAPELEAVKEEEKKLEEIEAPVIEVAEVPAEEPVAEEKTEEKPKTTSRRKKTN